MMRQLSLLILISVAACSHAPDGARDWSLVELKLDAAAIHNRGVLPLWRSADISEFGLVPRAQGRMTTTAAGRILVDVNAEEPLITLGGHRSVQSYRLVAFSGVLSADGTQATQQDVAAMRAPLGVATQLRLQRSAERIEMQAWTGDKPLPYIYVFEPGAPRQSAVFVPTWKN